MSLQDFVCRAEDLPKKLRKDEICNPKPGDTFGDAEAESPLLSYKGKPLQYTTKDSGERKVFDSGMQRDTNTGKMQPDLVLDGPMFLRWVALMTRGAVKYLRRNWMKASGKEEFDRFKESAVRHFIQWYYELNPEEDHAAAVFFNINGAEYVRSLRSKEEDLRPSEAEVKHAVQTLKDVEKHTGPHPPVAELQHPSVCTYCRPEPEDVVDKTMAQDGTEYSGLRPEDLGSDYRHESHKDYFKERLANGLRYVFYRERGYWLVKVYEFETGQLFEEASFLYLDDAKNSFNRDRERDDS